MKNDFEAVGDFLKKFDFQAPETPSRVAEETRDFRLRFLLEELTELAEGYGLTLDWELSGHEADPQPQDLPMIADALVDLVYVALGMAHLHGFPWHALFAEVHKANMAKVHANGDSKRGYKFDVVKPSDWKAPNIGKVLASAGWVGPELPFKGHP